MKIWNKSEETQNFCAIDVCKLFMALVVIAIHTNPIVKVSNPIVVQCVMAIENLAVPFFFVASGFFLYINIQPKLTSDRNIDTYYKSYISKLIRMYCVWTLISLPLTIYGYYIAGDVFFHCVLSYIKYFLFVGKLYNSYHLWYLLALIYAVFMIWLLIRKKLSLIKITLVGLLLCFVADTMLLLETITEMPAFLENFVKLYQFIFNKGGVFTGMIYVSLGMLIACKKTYIKASYCFIGITLVNILQNNTNIYIYIYQRYILKGYVLLRRWYYFLCYC